MKREKKRTVKKKGGVRINACILAGVRGVTSWQLIWEIIKHPGTKVKCLAYGSLKGFLYLLQIPAELRGIFKSLNEDGTAFKQNVEYLVLKFGLLDDDGDQEIPDILDIRDAENPDGIEKQTDSMVSFSQEAATQQQIFISTVGLRGKPVCPAVIDFSYFDTDSSDRLLAELRRKCAADPNAEKMTDFLYSQITSGADYKLGLITMELAGNGAEFINLGKLYTMAVERGDAALRDQFDRGCLHTVDQLLRLTIQSGIINYDCHLYNVLTQPSGEKTYLIDFGRILKVDTDFPLVQAEAEGSLTRLQVNATKRVFKNGDIFGPTAPSFDDAYAEIKGMLDEGPTSFTPGRDVSEDIAIEKMNKVMEFAAKVDYSIGRARFAQTRPQMIQILQSLYGPGFSDNWVATSPDFTITPDVRAKYAEILRLFSSETTTDIDVGRSATNPANIRRLIADGALFSNLPADIKTYNRSEMDTWDDAAGAIAPGGACVVAGGAGKKRTSRSTKKRRLTKKQRISRKKSYH